MEEAPPLEDIIIYARGKAPFTYREIKSNTNTDREFLDNALQSVANIGKQLGIEKFASELDDSPSWESTANDPYIPYNPYIFGYQSPYRAETYGSFWKCVFNQVANATIVRPPFTWPIQNSNMIGLPKNTVMIISGLEKPPSYCTSIQFTAIYFNLTETQATSVTNTANNGQSFFIVPQTASAKEKWQIYTESTVTGRTGVVRSEYIAEWCTFDEMCSIAHKVDYNTISVASGNGTNEPTIFVAALGSGLNVTHTRCITWTWEFPDGIFLATGDALKIKIGEALNAVQLVGFQNLKNLTAIAYFKKAKMGTDSSKTNTKSIGIAIFP